MSKNIIYKVDQVDTYTTAEFDKILSACAKIQMPKEYLISLYSRVVSNNKDSAEHISPFEGIKTKNVAIQFPKYNEVLSGIMNDLGKFTPLEFMKNYTAAEFGIGPIADSWQFDYRHYSSDRLYLYYTQSNKAF